ncbi:hypothetical protein BH708_12380 [Brachybacterium sp. P6-10-X1]|uniref:phosphatase PAP2 family protein n=1 Tax=Brachybacterium sp. P6-10-X1 TaxID=1903186 RepID=UPI0009717DA5|nr:phosphatase PAP2 family protein [Brachybacterium sp. P6-10-X1]APX33379.1 hypothetical protein BH708_12380 [Brachybacterium sp. P6-10-X1]
MIIPSADLEGRGRALRRAVPSALGVLGTILLAAALGGLIRVVPVVGALDERLVAAAGTSLTTPGQMLALGLDAIFDPLFAALLTVAVVLVVALARRSPRAGARTGILILVPWAATGALKVIVRRPRPEVELLGDRLVPLPETFSFPSGHTTVAAALCLAILLALRAGWGRWIGGVLAVVVVAATAWSRVALGLHHPTDVLTSALLAPVLVVLLARGIDAGVQRVEAGGRSPSRGWCPRSRRPGPCGTR